MGRARPLILLVEDQLELRQMYAQQLELSGFDVIQAGNGADALTHTAAHAPDVVLMDLSLPILDGWEATRRLKKDPLTSQIPVVALTGHALAGHEEGARNAGCDSFVTKPCIPADLEAEIRRVLAARPGARGGR